MPAEAAITGSEAGAAGLQGRKKPPMFPKIVDMAEEDGSWAKQSDKEGNGAGVLPETSPPRKRRSALPLHQKAAQPTVIQSAIMLKTIRIFYGTFWVYPYSTSACDGLKVHIPISNAWLGPISKSVRKYSKSFLKCVLPIDGVDAISKSCVGTTFLYQEISQIGEISA